MTSKSDSDFESELSSSDDDKDQDLFQGEVCFAQFCNRLREQTKPLLTKKVTSPSKVLRESKNDKLKDSKAKKRLIRAKQEPPNGFIERRYGYIPNPRWPKTGLPYSKPYEPKGVDANDVTGVQGVLFRNPQSGKLKGPVRNSSVNHSYAESDFPELSFSSTNRSLVTSTPSNSLGPGKTGDSCSSVKKYSGNYKEETSTDKSLSPLSSTPKDVYIHGDAPFLVPAISKPMANITPLEGGDYKKSPSEDSKINRSQIQEIVICRNNDGQSSPSVSNVTSHSDQSTPSPLTHRKNMPVGNCSVPSRDNKASRISPLLCDFNHNSQSSLFQSPGGSWSSIVRENSPLHMAEKKNSIDPSVSSTSSPTMSQNRKKEGNPTRLSDLTRPESPLSGSGDRGQSPVMSWSQVAKGSASSKQNSLKSVSTESGTTKQQNRSVDAEVRAQKTKRESSKNKKSAKNNRNDTEVHQPKQKNTSRNGSIQIVLEDFVTPKKQNGKKSFPQAGKKNLSMLENRFVEQIEANPTSPPKKVRPSPIKKLSFSRNNTLQGPILDASGDAKGNFELKENPCDPNSAQTVAMPTWENKENKVKTKPQDMKMSALYKRMSEKNGPVLSLESLLLEERLASKDGKDIFEDENEDEDEYAQGKSLASTQADIFWQTQPVTEKLTNYSFEAKSVARIQPESSEDEDAIPDLTIETIPAGDACGLGEKSGQTGFVLLADPSKVTCKYFLKRLSRQYCYFIEGHLMPNLSVELYFIVQLLTCTEVNEDMLNFVDHHLGGTYFQSVHNGVYFAVSVIKRLRSLFLCLENSYLELLAASERIRLFSPKLHTFFKRASERRKKVPVATSTVGHNVFIPEDDGFLSFPETNFAHVFKCQRDNFYAFYRHYHDSESIYEFKMENQIQYVYDGCTPEQNSLFNLMHLAKLFVEHMILVCVHQSTEKVDVIKMIESKGKNKDLFSSLYENFMATFNPIDGTACPPPGFSDSQMFFKDFLETLSCPAFNEHMRNIVVSKILELNSDDFGTVRNLHSTKVVREDQTPLRCHKFTESVLTLCLLAKFLGYLTFAPYAVASQSIPPELTSSIMQMRELVPLPLPFPALIKKAFERGHLSMTVPWIVEYLSMMDPVAPKLTVYSSILQKLQYIQRYAWNNLYKEGHTNTAVLIVSSISWLFETLSIPAAPQFPCDLTIEEKQLCDSRNMFYVDCQKLVTQRLVSMCCPYIEQGQLLLVQFELNQHPASRDRDVIPVMPQGDVQVSGKLKPDKDHLEIEEWLNSSLSLHSEVKLVDPECTKNLTTVIDDEVIPAYVLTRLFTSKVGNDTADLEANFIQNNPYVKACVNMAVELVTAKIFDYTLRTILRVLVFEVKMEIRSRFEGITQGYPCDTLKDRIVAESFNIAQRYMDKARTSFFEVVERCCSKELPDLVAFFTSSSNEEVKTCSIHLSQKLVLERVKEWALVQIYPEFFQRILIKEVDKGHKGNPKYTSLYPSDFSRKLESLQATELSSGFDEMEQLSELIDKALSYGVWYINALTPGTRPDDTHMIQLIEDFICCVEKSMVTMDFAFYVMSNFLMHLIIQYIVDAPQNWTDEAANTFLRLCHLCKAKKLENDKLAIKLSEFVKKKKRMKVKVVNLMSVHSLVWLTKSESINETLMAYCKLIVQLVESHLLHVETVYTKLTQSRDNSNVSVGVKKVVNQILVKVLQLLWESPDRPDASSYSRERIAGLLQNAVSAFPTSDMDEVSSNFAALIEETFGHVLSVGPGQ